MILGLLLQQLTSQGIFLKSVSHLWHELNIAAGLEAVDLGSPRHEAFGAILPFMNETIDGGDVEKEQVLLKNPLSTSMSCC